MVSLRFEAVRFAAALATGLAGALLLALFFALARDQPGGRAFSLGCFTAAALFLVAAGLGASPARRLDLAWIGNWAYRGTARPFGADWQAQRAPATTLNAAIPLVLVAAILLALGSLT